MQRETVPFVLLDLLKDGPVEYRSFRELAKMIAGTEHNGRVAMLRLIERGLVKVDATITEAGKRELNKVLEKKREEDP